MTPEQLRQRRRDRNRIEMYKELLKQQSESQKRQIEYELQQEERRLRDGVLQNANRARALSMATNLFLTVPIEAYIALAEMQSAEARLKAFREIHSRG